MRYCAGSWKRRIFGAACRRPGRRAATPPACRRDCRTARSRACGDRRPAACRCRRVRSRVERAACVGHGRARFGNTASYQPQKGGEAGGLAVSRCRGCEFAGTGAAPTVRSGAGVTTAIRTSACTARTRSGPGLSYCGSNVFANARERDRRILVEQVADAAGDARVPRRVPGAPAASKYQMSSSVFSATGELRIRDVRIRAQAPGWPKRDRRASSPRRASEM